MTFLMAKAAEQGFPGIINTDPFHPGLFVHVRQPAEGDVRDYVRTEDFRTGEVAVRWKDDRGSFRRRLFVSRPHNVIVFSHDLRAARTNCLRPGVPDSQACRKDSPSATRAGVPGITADLLLPHRDHVRRTLVTFHNIYARGKGGFDVAVRVVVDGGAHRGC